MELYSLQGDSDIEHVRTTGEVPKRVSVIDVIKAVGDVQHPRSAWRDICSAHPEAVALTHGFKFPGRGQNLTPVTDARGLVIIIFLLPSRKAARFRAAGAELLVRHLGGDETLVEEIRRNRERQAQLPDSDPARMFGEAVESRQPLRSVTGVQNFDQPQVYMGFPEGPWSDVRAHGNPVPADVDLYQTWLLKTGMQLTAGRITSHTPTYGGFRLLESCLSPACGKLEQEWKATLRDAGRLVRGKHAKRGGQEDTELLWVKDAQDYADNIIPLWMQLVQRAGELTSLCSQPPHADQTRRIEALEGTKQEEERTKQAQARVRQLELELELARLQNGVVAPVPPTPATADVPTQSRASSRKRSLCPGPSVQTARSARSGGGEEGVEEDAPTMLPPTQQSVVRGAAAGHNACYLPPGFHPRYMPGECNSAQRTDVIAARDGREVRRYRSFAQAVGAISWTSSKPLKTATAGEGGGECDGYRWYAVKRGYAVTALEYPR